MISANLGDELEAFFAKLIETGSNNSEGAVLREGVRRVQALDAAIERGLADASAGRTKPADAVFDRLEAKYRGVADE